MYAPLSGMCRHFVQDHALQWIAVIFPWLAFQRAESISVTNLPAAANTGWAEVDVLGVILIVKPRRKQTNHVHARQTAILAQLPNARVLAFLLGDELDQLRHDVAQLVDLTLTCDMAGDPARILNVFVAMQDLPDGLRLNSCWIPHMDRVDQGVPSRIVREDGFRRRIR